MKREVIILNEGMSKMRLNKWLWRDKAHYLNEKRKSFCILLFLFAFVLLSPIISAADVVTIGTNYSTYDHIPIEPYYSYTYSQCMYLQSDIDPGEPSILIQLNITGMVVVAGQTP